MQMCNTNLFGWNFDEGSLRSFFSIQMYNLNDFTKIWNACNIGSSIYYYTVDNFYKL